MDDSFYEGIAWTLWGTLFALIIIGVASALINDYTQPETRYFIDAERGHYYTDSFITEDGFIKLTDWYSGFVIYQHHTEELILQGNMEIKELSAKEK